MFSKWQKCKLISKSAMPILLEQSSSRKTKTIWPRLFAKRKTFVSTNRRFSGCALVLRFEQSRSLEEMGTANYWWHLMSPCWRRPGSSWTERHTEEKLSIFARDFHAYLMAARLEWGIPWSMQCMRRVSRLKCQEAKCREKSLENSGLEPTAPNRPADWKHCALSTQPNPI